MFENVNLTLVEARNIVNILRYIILIFSIIVILLWVTFGRIQGSAFDLVSIVVILFFAANTFYLIFSKPNFKLSDFFDRTATRLALVTLEVRYQASQARSKELEAERLKVEKGERMAHKLNAAKEFMEFAANNPQVKKHFELSGNDALGKNAVLAAGQFTTVETSIQISNTTPTLRQNESDTFNRH